MAISNRQPNHIVVAYTVDGARRYRTFDDVFKAKSFYVRADRLGQSPRVVRAETTFNLTPTQETFNDVSESSVIIDEESQS